MMRRKSTQKSNLQHSNIRFSRSSKMYIHFSDFSSSAVTARRRKLMLEYAGRKITRFPRRIGPIIFKIRIAEWIQPQFTPLKITCLLGAVNTNPIINIRTVEQAKQRLSGNFWKMEWGKTRSISLWKSGCIDGGALGIKKLLGYCVHLH